VNRSQRFRRRIQWLTGFFIAGLVLSGTTAIPLPGELDFLVGGPELKAKWSEPAPWLWRVQEALTQTQSALLFPQNSINRIDR